MIEHGFTYSGMIALVGMTFMGCLAFPGISAGLWQHLTSARRSRTVKKDCKRKKKREERLKKYWEIDIRNFK